MKFASYIDYFGTPAKEIPCITGVGAPTSTTEGAVGCLYMDTNSGDIYKCISDASGVYIWEDLNAEIRNMIANLQEIIIALAERVKILEENGVTGGGGAGGGDDSTLTPTEGLAYSLSDDGTYYTCAGIGTATDTDIVIAQNIEGVPVTKIGLKAFYDIDTITSVIIPYGITRIDGAVFANSALLTSVNIPDSVTTIGTNAFAGCSSLTSVTIPDSVTSIGGSAFDNCKSLTSITIPDSVTSIGDNTFSHCTGLTSIIIPNSVTSIKNWAFGTCTGLTSVKFIGQPPTIQSNTFNGCNNVAKYDFRGATSVPTLSSTKSLGHASGCQIVVPDSLYDSWQQATNWAALTDVVWVKASEYTEE